MIRRVAWCFFIVILFCSPLQSPFAAPVTANTELTTSNKAMFIENVGQFSKPAQYLISGDNPPMWLTDSEIWITLKSTELRNQGASELNKTSPQIGVNIRIKYLDTNTHSHLEPFNRLSTNVSFLKGSDQMDWYSSVPVWGGVRYVDLYPGIDLELTIENDSITQRLIAEPGTDLGKVRLAVDGANDIQLGNGRLQITTDVGLYQLALPILKSDSKSNQNFSSISGNVVSFPFSINEDHSILNAPEIPSQVSNGLRFSTYLGGGSTDNGVDIAINSSGQSIIVGSTNSYDFPVTVGSYQDYLNDSTDVVVVRLSASGSNILAATYLGSYGTDIPYAIELAPDGLPIIVGATRDASFPTTAGAYDRSYNGGSDVFITKLNSAGSALVFSTLLGGTSNDVARALAIDPAGRIYLTGSTSSTGFPTTTNGFDRSHNGNTDAFLVEVSSTGASLLNSTYFGGAGSDIANAIGIASDGKVYLAGQTTSQNLPTTAGVIDSSYSNGYLDGFVSQFNANANSLFFSTYLGGTLDDSALTLVTHTDGVYIAGITASKNFPTTIAALDKTPGGDGCGWPVHDCNDGFISHINIDGTSLLASTYLGSWGDDEITSLAVTPNGSLYLVGSAQAQDFPITPDAVDLVNMGGDCGAMICPDGIVVQIDSNLTKLKYGSYLGGTNFESLSSIAVDSQGYVYITGKTTSPDFPTTPGAYDRTINDGTAYGDMIVAKILAGIPEFTITGQVKFEDRGLAGVQVSTNLGHQTITNSSGFYTLRVPAGSYSISSIKAGYYFLPSSAPINVSSNITGYDFIGKMNFTVSHIEVIQSIQTITNSVQLIAGKPTAVRAFLQSITGTVSNIQGVLYANNGKGWVEIPMEKENYTASPSSERSNPKHALLFILPNDMWNSSLELYVEIYVDAADAHIRYPSTGTQTHSFIHTDPIRIGYIPISHNFEVPSEKRIAVAYKYLQSIYPVSQVDYFSVPFFLPFLDKSDVPPDTCDINLIKHLNTIYTWYKIFGWPPPNGKPHQLFGWVPDSTWGLGGCSNPLVYDGQSLVAYGSDTPDNEVYQVILAHEIAHNLGRKHPCEGEDPSWPHSNYSINDVGFDFDFYSPKSLVKDNVDDFMIGRHCGASATAPKWTSAYTYNQLYESLQNEVLSTETQQITALETIPPNQPVLLVTGSIYTNSIAKFDTAYQLTSSQWITQTTGTQYCISLQSVNGETLTSSCFDLSFIDSETNNYQQTNSFVQVLPFTPSASKLVLTQGTTQLTEKIISTNPPTITLQYPNTAQVISGTIDVVWHANDIDGDELEYAVSYSTNNGQNWYQLGFGITQTHFSVNTNNLPGSTLAQIQVIASDGINTTSDISDNNFTVLGHLPSAHIISPQNDISLPLGQTLLLEGYGFDLEDGVLSNSSFSWSSSLNGVLGNGRILAVKNLSFGNHLITLTVTDNSGNVSTASITASIGQRIYLPVIRR